jgi:hypothetical protein
MKAEKFLCGNGVETLYYCEICGLPYVNCLDAIDCEKSHKAKPENLVKEERVKGPGLA